MSQVSKKKSPAKKGLAPLDQMIISDLETLKVLTDPMRLEILDLMGKPITVKEIAKALKVAPTKLYYHIGQLEEHKIIQVVDTRIVSGIIEKHYQAIAKSFTIDRKLLAVGQDNDQTLSQIFHSLVDGVGADIHRGLQSGLIEIGENSPRHKRLMLGRSFFKFSLERAEEFATRMEALIEEFAAKDKSDTSEKHSYSLFIAFHSHSKALPEDEGE